MSNDELEHAEPDEESVERPTRVRAWTQIGLISLGIVVVGTALVVVLWLLFSLTMGLITELI